MTVAKAVAHDVFKAAMLGRELLLELAESKGFRVHVYCIARSPKCRKGIIARNSVTVTRVTRKFVEDEMKRAG